MPINAHVHYLPSGLRLIRQMTPDGYTFAGSPTGEHQLFGHSTERMLAHWRGYVQVARDADETVGAQEARHANAS